MIGSALLAEVPFTARGALRGARLTLPLAPSVAAFGSVLGVLAKQADLTLLQAVLMSGLVYAGSAQFVVVELWTAPLPVLSLVLTTLIINLRHLLMGASLRPWFGRLPAAKAYGSLFFVADESWALAMGEHEHGESDAAFLVGSGLVLYGSWVTATAVGYTAGGIVRDPERWGLDFVFAAAFAALLVGMYKGTRDLAPWTVAAGVALVADWLLPGNWYVLLGGVAGCVVGAVRDER